MFVQPAVLARAGFPVKSRALSDANADSHAYRTPAGQVEGDDGERSCRRAVSCAGAVLRGEACHASLSAGVRAARGVPQRGDPLRG